MEASRKARSSLRRFKRARFWALSLSTATLLAACGSSASTASSSSATTSASSAKTTAAKSSGAATGSTYTIHVLLSETGSLAFLGGPAVTALHSLQSEVNASGGIDGHPVNFNIEDNQSTPSVSVSLASKWISQGVPFILNGNAVPTDSAVDALAGPNGPFMFALSPGIHGAAGSMVFSTGVSTQYMAQTYLTYFKAKGLTNIAEMNSTDGSGTDGWNQLQTELKDPQFSSMHLLTHQTFDPTSVNVSAQLSVIKAAHPQALIIWTTGTPFGTVLKGMQALGMDSIPTVTTEGNATHAEMKNFASVLPKDLYFTNATVYLPLADITNAAVKAKVATFDKAVTAAGAHPGDSWGLVWDPANLMIGAVQKLGINATAKQILNYMENLHNVPGIYGLYNTSTSNHSGLSAADDYMMIWNGNGFAPVSQAGGTPLTSG